MTLSDTELLQRMKSGDEQAFGVLYQRHQRPVYRFALLMTGSANTAEDVVQEVFLELIREVERYNPARAPLNAYLCGIARNHVRRRLVRERPYVQLTEETSVAGTADGLRTTEPED